MKKEFLLRGKTASSGEEVINISGIDPGYGYRLVQFDIWPADSLDSTRYEMYASLTAEPTAADPINPNFDKDGLIGTAMFHSFANPQYGTPASLSLINDLFICTQNLKFSCRETDSGAAVNWQMKFESVKMNSSHEAVNNYTQFAISDG